MWHFPVNVLCASSLLPSSGTEGSDYLLSEAPLPPPPFSGHARRALAGGTFILSFQSGDFSFFFFSRGTGSRFPGAVVPRTREEAERRKVCDPEGRDPTGALIGGMGVQLVVLTEL